MNHASPSVAVRHVSRARVALVGLLCVSVLAGCGGRASHKKSGNSLVPPVISAETSSATPTITPSTSPSSTPTTRPSVTASALPPSPTAAPPLTPAPTPTDTTASALATLRTTAISRCQALIANAPEAGPCQYIRTIVPASDHSYVYVEVAAAGHDGTVFHDTAGNYAPVFDNGDQPPPCSKVTAAGIPLNVWTDVVHQIQGSSAGAACYG